MIDKLTATDSQMIDRMNKTSSYIIYPKIWESVAKNYSPMLLNKKYKLTATDSQMIDRMNKTSSYIIYPKIWESVAKNYSPMLLNKNIN